MPFADPPATSAPILENGKVSDLNPLFIKKLGSDEDAGNLHEDNQLGEAAAFEATGLGTMLAPNDELSVDLEDMSHTNVENYDAHSDSSSEGEHQVSPPITNVTQEPVKKETHPEESFNFETVEGSEEQSKEDKQDLCDAESKSLHLYDSSSNVSANEVVQAQTPCDMKVTDCTEQLFSQQKRSETSSTSKNLANSNEVSLRPSPVQHTNSIGSSAETSSGESETSDDDQKTWIPEYQNRKRVLSDSSTECVSTNPPERKLAKTDHEASSPIEIQANLNNDTGLDSSAPVTPSSLNKSRYSTPEKTPNIEVKTDEYLYVEDEANKKKATPRQKRTVNRTSKSGRKRRSKKGEYSDDDDELPKRSYSDMKEDMRQASVTWTLVYQLIHVRNQIQMNPAKHIGKKLTKINTERVNKFIEKYLQTQDSHYMRAEITLNTLFPDQGNYRHCYEYLTKKTISVSPPPQRREKKQIAAVPENPPRLQLTGTLYLDFDCTADDVIEAASHYYASHVNDVYNPPSKVYGPTPDLSLLNAEQEMYSEQRKGLSDHNKYRIPCPTLKVNSKDDVFSPDFERILNSASITNVSGIAKALAIDTALFSLEQVTRCRPELEIDILHQVPQSADGNCTSKGIRSWTVHSVSGQMKLKEFNEYMKNEEKSAYEAYEMIANCPAKSLKEACQQLREKRINLVSADGCDPTMPWIKFGTNIDLLTDEFKPQREQLQKLPTFLHPHRKGNLLNYTDVDVLGINTVQMYAKPIGSRTPAHMENSLMASINWNRGPGTCVWFAVPYEYWGQLEFLVVEHRHKYQDQDYWPDENELLELGIPVIKFEQKADEMVYVNTGCFHWVQSNGFCVNVSWNVGQPNFTQLATSVVAYDHNLQINHQAHIPLVHLIWNLAREKMFLDNPDMYKLMRSVMIRSLAHCQWYFDLIRHHDHKSGDASHWVKFDRVQRCKYCKCEIFNIVRWYTQDNNEIDSYAFCCYCKVPKEFQENRFLKYTWFYTLDDLKKTFDEYVRE